MCAASVIHVSLLYRCCVIVVFSWLLASVKVGGLYSLLLSSLQKPPLKRSAREKHLKMGLYRHVVAVL